MNPSLPWGELAALTASLVWAITSIFFTSAGRMAPPVATNFFKTGGAIFLFALALLVRDGLPWGVGISTGDFLLLAGSGVLGLTVGDSFLFQCYQVLGTRRALLVQSMNPIMGAWGGWLLLGEHLGFFALAGMGVALGGITLVLSGRLASGFHPEPGKLRMGILLGTGAAAGQAFGALMAKPALAHVDTLAATQIRVVGATVALLVLALTTRQLGNWMRQLLRKPVLWRLTLATILGPFIALWLMVISLARCPTGIALTLLSTAPLWMLPLGAIFQKDVPTFRECAGAVVAIGGIALLLLF